MNKNIGHFQAFDKDFFTKHQAKLLWLLNAPVSKHWFRYVLRIKGHDLRASVKITVIAPNSFSYGDRHFNEGGVWFTERTTDFRVHPKYGKRLYYAFRPVWWVAHFWDWVLADRFLPRLSFGLLTLTAYPAAGANSPVDGEVSRSAGAFNETFSTIRAGAGDSADATSTTMEAGRLDSSGTTNQYTRLFRGIALFDTSAITAFGVISGVVLSLYGTTKVNNLGSPALHIAGSTPASNSTLANADYGQVQRTSFGSVGYASFSAAGYNDITLNASGISNISKTGISKFSTQLDWDINNSFTGAWAGGVASILRCSTADASGTSQDPKLVVTYASPSGAFFTFL